jgi:phage gpG-like protein
VSVFSLLAFAARLEAMDHDLKGVEGEIIAKACVLVADRAKDLIGRPHGFWPALATETIERHGNTPLLDTGEMRDSIVWNSDAHEGYVGSNNKKAVWQELGTSRGVPPRSFLRRAALQMEGKSTGWLRARSPPFWGGAGLTCLKSARRSQR